MYLSPVPYLGCVLSVDAYSLDTSGGRPDFGRDRFMTPFARSRVCRVQAQVPSGSDLEIGSPSLLVEVHCVRTKF